MAAGLTLVATGNAARAQSADAIIDKLVEKGILTTEEAGELREEANRDFEAAQRETSGLPEYVDDFKFHGDFRGRYDGIYRSDSDFEDRHRFRYRVRAGLTVSTFDQFDIGLELASGNLDDPISNNATFENNASKKDVVLNLAYVRWSPIKDSDWRAVSTFGKMKNPFATSPIVFDGDYNPEGFAQSIGYAISEQHALDLVGGAFVIDEFSRSSNDPFLFGGQIRWDAEWNERLSSSFGLGAFLITNEETLANLSVPNVNIGNDRRNDVAMSPVYGFQALYVDGSVTRLLESFPGYPKAFPITVAGDFLKNADADNDDTGYSVGVTFGKAGKKGTWDVGYEWRYLEANAWYEETTDSDFGAYYGSGLPNSGRLDGYHAGTNVKGHIVAARYSPFDNLTLGVTALFTDTINTVPGSSDGTITRILGDAAWKF